MINISSLLHYKTIIMSCAQRLGIQNVLSVFRRMHIRLDISLVMRKPAFCICENKDADQLRGNPEADQRLCFCYTDSTITLLLKSEISSL